MRRVAPGEPAFHTAVAVIGLAVFIRRHPDHLAALHFRLERTAHAAVGAGRDDLVIGLAVLDDALLHQRRRRAGLHAGAAGHALGIEEVFAHAGRDFGLESATFYRQREGALDFVAGAYAARADDALRGIELEIGIAGVDRCVQVILAVEAVADVAQADRAGHVLQLAVAVRRAGQAVQRVVGDVQFHDITPDFRKRIGLCANLHARLDRRRARGRVTLATLNLDQAKPARAKRLEAVSRAELRDIDARFASGPQDGGARSDGRRQTVDFDLHGLRVTACGRAQVNLSRLVHRSSPEDAKSSAKCFRTLLTG